jgi:hypothetical protein
LGSELPVLAIFGKVLLAETSFPDYNDDAESREVIEIWKKALMLQSLFNLFDPAPIEILPNISEFRRSSGARI